MSSWAVYGKKSVNNYRMTKIHQGAEKGPKLKGWAIDEHNLLFFFFKYVFIWLHWVLVAACRSLWQREDLLVVARGLSRPVNTWGLSSWTRERTCVPCIGR